MKIRMGFVSNSSSSSFCIYGVTLNKEESKHINSLTYEELPNWIFTCERSDYGTLVIGREWKTIKGDETGFEFMQTVQEGLRQLGITKECQTLEDAWYDG